MYFTSRRFVLMFLLTFLLGLAAFNPQLGYADTEPNDTPAQANEIVIGWNNAVVDATLATNTDKDIQ